MFGPATLRRMELSALDLNLLLVLHAVLEERSVVRAARRLHVTPPAVSNALSRLRDVLGDPLFVRSGRGIVPTPHALELAPTLARIVADAERVISGPERDPAATTRELTIALSDSDQVASLPTLAAAVARRMPRARLRVVSVDTLISRGGLEGGAADAAVGPEELARGLRSAPLYEDDAVIVLRRGHPALRRRMTREAFLALRHVDVHLALGRGGVGHRVAEQALAKHGLVRDVAVTVPTFTAAALVAAATDLAAGVPRRVAERIAPMAELAIVEPPVPSFRFRIHLLWHERTHADPVLALFREIALDTMGERPRKKRAARRAPGAASSRA